VKDGQVPSASCPITFCTQTLHSATRSLCKIISEYHGVLVETSNCSQLFVHSPRDRIYLFGFSRGAYTARALAGMLHKVGLLPQFNNEQVPFAYKIFARTDKAGWDLSNKFKETFTAYVKLTFILSSPMTDITPLLSRFKS
jgi:hypothetical protein